MVHEKRSKIIAMFDPMAANMSFHAGDGLLAFNSMDGLNRIFWYAKYYVSKVHWIWCRFDRWLLRKKSLTLNFVFVECKCRENEKSFYVEVLKHVIDSNGETTFECSHIAISLCLHCFKHPVERFQITRYSATIKIIFHLWQKSAFVPLFDCHIIRLLNEAPL